MSNKPTKPNFKILETICNTGYVFNQVYFKNLFDQRVKSERENGRHTKEAEFLALASLTNVTTEAVKQWYFSYCGPGDVSIVKKIASYYNVDYKSLLIPDKGKEGERKKDLVMNNEDEVIKIIYDMIIDHNDIQRAIIRGREIPLLKNVINPNERWSYLFEHGVEINDFIDRASLLLSNENWAILHSIAYSVIENDGYSCPESWEEINPDIPWARLLFLREDQESEFESIEARQYQIDRLTDKLAGFVPHIKNSFDNWDEEDLIEHIYKIEFIRTIKQLFKDYSISFLGGANKG